MTDDKVRWARAFKVRELITTIMRELNDEPGDMTARGERAIEYIAHEVLHLTPPGVAVEHVEALGRLHDEMMEDRR